MSDQAATYVRSRLSYCAQTGQFRWLTGRRGLPGTTAGCRMNRGYWAISIDGKSYLAHRLAWLITYGIWPEGQIDHINGDRADNRLCNLRAVSNAENAQNKRRARSDNDSGLLGVRQLGSRWQARIMKAGKAIHLGAYETKEAAHAAYLAAKRQLHEACTI